MPLGVLEDPRVTGSIFKGLANAPWSPPEWLGPDAARVNYGPTGGGAGAAGPAADARLPMAPAGAAAPAMAGQDLGLQLMQTLLTLYGPENLVKLLQTLQQQTPQDVDEMRRQSRLTAQGSDVKRLTDVQRGAVGVQRSANDAAAKAATLTGVNRRTQLREAGLDPLLSRSIRPQQSGETDSEYVQRARDYRDLQGREAEGRRAATAGKIFKLGQDKTPWSTTIGGQTVDSGQWTPQGPVRADGSPATSGVSAQMSDLQKQLEEQRKKEELQRALGQIAGQERGIRSYTF